MKISLLLITLLSLAAAPAVAAEVYKWKDAEGRTRYTDIPPPSNIPYVTLSGKKSPQPAPIANPADVQAPSADNAEPPPSPATAAKPPAAAGGAPKTPADKELENAKKKQAAEEEKKKAEAKQSEEKLRERNCAAANANLRQLRQEGRVFSTNEKGERVYMNDADRAMSIKQAEKEVEEWCNQK